LSLLSNAKRRLTERDDEGRIIWVYRLMFLLFSWDPEPMEFFLSATAILLGIWLLLPFSLFGMAPDFFRVMEYIAPEWAWGSVILAMGLLQGWGVSWGSLNFANEEVWGKFRRRRITICFVSLMCWLFLLLTFAMGNWRAMGTCLFLSIAASNFVTYIRLRWIR
jgi:hypothetical protein